MENNAKILELLNLLVKKSKLEISKFIDDYHPIDILDSILEYDGDKFFLLNKLPDNVIVRLIEEATDDDKRMLLNILLEKFTKPRQKKIIKKIAVDELVDLIGSYSDKSKVDNIFENLDKEDIKEVKELLTYKVDTAGGIMATEYIVIKEFLTVKETIDYLKVEGKDAETTNCLYVLDDAGKLKGFVSLRDIILSDFDSKISDIMNTNVISVDINLDQELVANIFQKYRFSTLPVIDEDNIMKGIITYDDIIEILTEEDTEDFKRMAALTYNEKDKEKEYLEVGVFGHSKNRIAWLLILMVSATFTGIIIRGFENVLERMIILSSFIPLLMDTGGNAGAQSSTLIIRSMALGQLSFKNLFVIIFKELRISLVVGSILAVVNLLRIVLLERISIQIALTVSIALLFTIIIAKLIGCVLPLLAKKIKIDPAIMAAPLITTIVDALALIVYFYLAKVFLNI